MVGLGWKERGNVILSESNNTTNLFQVPDGYEGLSVSVSNDGVNDLTITVNNLTVIVKAGETFDDDFESFSSVLITSSVAYRIIIRG